MLRVVELLDLGWFQEVFQTFVVFFKDDIAICTIDEEKWEDVVLFISTYWDTLGFIWLRRLIFGSITCLTILRLTLKIGSWAILLSISNIDLLDVRIGRAALRFWFHPINDLSQQLHSSLGFPLHQKDNSLCKDLIIVKFLLSQVQMYSSLQVVVRFIEVFLLDLDLGYFIKGWAWYEVVFTKP